MLRDGGRRARRVLNAKQHAREAAIVVQAGRPGAVTIATNMAGRGTDIVLGGNLTAELEELSQQGAGETELEAARAAWRERHDAVVAAGGLHIIGTERHESRRIDNQLRGRSGRQGDPGVEPLLPVVAGRSDAAVRIRSRRRESCRSSAWSTARRSSTAG